MTRQRKLMLVRHFMCCGKQRLESILGAESHLKSAQAKYGTATMECYACVFCNGYHIGNKRSSKKVNEHRDVLKLHDLLRFGFNEPCPMCAEEGKADAEVRTLGKCQCGRAVVKIQNSRTPMLYTNGDSYIYDGKPIVEVEGEQREYSIFRCDDCSSVISDVWQPDRQSADARKKDALGRGDGRVAVVEVIETVIVIKGASDNPYRQIVRRYDKEHHNLICPNCGKEAAGFCWGGWFTCDWAEDCRCVAVYAEGTAFVPVTCRVREDANTDWKVD